MLDVKIKRLWNEAVVPEYARESDAGLDLTCVSKSLDVVARTLTYGTGLSIEIPEGHVGLLLPRSSIYKKGLRLANSVGVIDAGYRGEIKVIFDVSDRSNVYMIGDRIAQLVILPYPQVNLIEVTDLSSTSRGDGGFGSTGDSKEKR